MIYFITILLMLATLCSYSIAIMSGLTYGHEVQADWWFRVAGLEGCAFVVCLILSFRKMLKGGT